MKKFNEYFKTDWSNCHNYSETIGLIIEKKNLRLFFLIFAEYSLITNSPAASTIDILFASYKFFLIAGFI
jgi:hypothetical protein